jgi:peptidoglycan-associated lipoprotein
MRKFWVFVVIALLVGLFVGCGGQKEMVKPEEQPTPPEATKEEPSEGEQPSYPQEEVTETPIEERIKLEMIHFEFDRYRLLPEFKRVLEENARKLKMYPEVKISIEGHCDERGTIEYNLALGEKRARTAQDYLINLGIDPSRITIISYGKERPLDSRHNEEAWYKNRRDEFKITSH